LIEEEQTSLERIARIWVAFVLYGGLFGFLVFVGMVFGLRQSQWYAAAIAVIVGVSLGFGLAHVLGARKLAARILGFLYYLGWLNS